jgi:ABC-type uncharacterized transport system auxiliary subunit
MNIQTLQPICKTSLLLLITSLGLASCTGVLESNKPVREVYLLQPPAQPAKTAEADAPDLILALTAVPGLDTDDIQILGTNSRLNPVGNAHWADNLPEVMSSLSRRSLVDSGQFARVTLSGLARPEQWFLELELQAFYGLQDSSGSTRSVILQMEGNIHCNGSSTTMSVRSSQAVDSAGMADLVAAHQKALNEALSSLPGKISQACQKI